MFTIAKLGGIVVIVFIVWLLTQVFNRFLGPATFVGDFVRGLFDKATVTAKDAKTLFDEKLNELGNQVEMEGFVTSDGQNDPILQYNLARVKEADLQGLLGEDRQTPAGFPTFKEWQAQQVGGG